MDTFHERLYSEKSKELFAPMIPTVLEVADLLVKEAYKKFSKSQYDDAEIRSLSMSWLPSFEFQACATINKQDLRKHSIEIAYGAPIDIYKDSFLYKTMCTTYFTRKEYNEVFEALDYGEGRNNVLPADLQNDIDAKILFNDLSITWLYLHEQAHLFQAHGIIYTQYAENLPADFSLNWNEFEVNQILPDQESERNAWIRHACELSADYEATNLIVQHVMSLNKAKNWEISLSSIWMLISALTCIFHKFYGDTRTYHQGLAVGTHPDPAIRMKYIYLNVIALLKNPYVTPYHQKGKTLNDYKKVMNHAYSTANLYIHIAHLNNKKSVPEFMERFDDLSDEYHIYTEGINKIWSELRPSVMENYFGYGNASVMPSPL